MLMYMCTGVAASMSYREVAEKVKADIHYGLSSAEATRRRQVHGYNEFEITEEEPLWKKYLGQVRWEKTLFKSLKVGEW